jgi:hypothetical protein
VPRADIGAEADSADGAINLPLFPNAFQSVGAEIVELNARRRIGAGGRFAERGDVRCHRTLQGGPRVLHH